MSINKCEKCEEEYIDIQNEWCKLCQRNYLKNDFTNWTSGNEKIDYLIQEMQLRINNSSDSVFEWISYDQFNDIKEVGKISLSIWKDGPLNYNKDEKKYTRSSNKKVVLRFLYYDLQNNTDEFLNEVKTYSIDYYNTFYGISQNSDTKDYIMVFKKDYYCEKCGEKYTINYHKWCKPCQINYFKNNFKNWTSGNEKIDNFIQEMQLSGISICSDTIFEWMPHNNFNDIKEIGKITLATWKDGLLNYNKDKEEYTRNSDKKVVLKYLHHQNVIDEVEKFKYSYKIYGISQNPDTKDYIMVLSENSFCEKCGERYTYTDEKWCKPCQINYIKNDFINWTSGNEEINDLIQEMQLEIQYYNDMLFEWIPYDQFNDIKEIGKIALAIWKDGPSCHDHNEKGLKRSNPDKKVALKCLSNEFLNGVKNIRKNSKDKIYGISQNPITKDYVMVLKDDYCEKCGEKYADNYYKWCKPCQINYLKNNFRNWTSENEKIDVFIQEMQLKINDYNDTIFEWIPYNHFNVIKEIVKSTIYLAIWKDGLLNYNEDEKEYIRSSDQKVVLKCLHNSQNQNIINEFLNEVKTYSIKKHDIKIYGISQNPDMKDYIIVFNKDYYCEKCGEEYTNSNNKWCKPCQINYLRNDFKNWTSGNEKIDNLIREMRLRVDYPSDIVFEWIPYDQFINIKEVGKGGFATVYSAIWKDGPLYYDHYKNKLKKLAQPYITIALKNLNNSQNISNEFLNEVKAYSINYNEIILRIYGISQNPNTKDYIIVFQYASCGNLNNWMNKNNIDWSNKLIALTVIINGLKIIHGKNMIHRDFHTGNILANSSEIKGNGSISISDMGLSGEVGNIDETKIYGVMPYTAPEVLRGKPYTKAADIYSFGMIMYFIATGKQPFSDRAHDDFLAINICNGIRPEISELEAPKCYIELMKKCLDSNLNNRPNATEVEESIESLVTSYLYDEEINKQFVKAEEYRKANLSSIKNNQSNTHSQAIYTSQLLNSFTKDLPKYDNVTNDLVIDFTK